MGGSLPGMQGVGRVVQARKYGGYDGHEQSGAGKAGMDPLAGLMGGGMPKARPSAGLRAWARSAGGRGLGGMAGELGGLDAAPAEPLALLGCWAACRSSLSWAAERAAAWRGLGGAAGILRDARGGRCARRVAGVRAAR